MDFVFVNCGTKTTVGFHLSMKAALIIILYIVLILYRNRLDFNTKISCM